MVISANIVRRTGYLKGGVGGYSVLQKSVAWETGVEGKKTKEFYFGDFLLLQSLENYFSNFREGSKYSLQFIVLAHHREDDA